ncbi:hypothetical protein EDB85DRAFT_2142894 [Lactarius pseudohatsudake]|nr:hypothetical protein EDB85DRAFT_2142894 [Lactarius pseudohatsudake]
MPSPTQAVLGSLSAALRSRESLASSSSIPRSPASTASLPSLTGAGSSSSSCTSLASLSSSTPAPNEHLAVLLSRNLWKQDTDAPYCDTFVCRKPFTLMERRHPSLVISIAESVVAFFARPALRAPPPSLTQLPSPSSIPHAVRPSPRTRRPPRPFYPHAFVTRATPKFTATPPHARRRLPHAPRCRCPHQLVQPEPEDEDDAPAAPRTAVSLLAQAWRTFRLHLVRLATLHLHRHDDRLHDHLRHLSQMQPTPYVPRRRRPHPRSIDAAAMQQAPLASSRPGTSPTNSARSALPVTPARAQTAPTEPLTASPEPHPAGSSSTDGGGDAGSSAGWWRLFLFLSQDGEATRDVDDAAAPGAAPTSSSASSSGHDAVGDFQYRPPRRNEPSLPERPLEFSTF